MSIIPKQCTYVGSRDKTVERHPDVTSIKATNGRYGANSNLETGSRVQLGLFVPHRSDIGPGGDDRRANLQSYERYVWPLLKVPTIRAKEQRVRPVTAPLNMNTSP